jgi:uncharacterized membrane protein (DUF373 family)
VPAARLSDYARPRGIIHSRRGAGAETLTGPARQIFALPGRTDFDIYCAGTALAPSGLIAADPAMLKLDWKNLPSYERFERAASYVVMFFISIIIVYSLAMMALNIFEDFKLGMGFLDTELLRDVFGSLLTILILIEFNHSIALSISKRSGILQARTIVLIAILVIARKVILLDFSSTSFEQLIGIGAVALAFGLLYWLINARSAELPESQPRN